MAIATLKNNGKTTRLQLLGSLEALTDPERAEIQALLDALISETDEEWLEQLARYDIPAKIRFLQFGKANILNSIMNKGVEIPDTQPFRTIFHLVDAIETGGETGSGFSATASAGKHIVDESALTTSNLSEMTVTATIQ